MTLLYIIHSLVAPPMLFPVNLADNIALLFIGGIAAFLLAYVLTFGIIAICHKTGWLDQPAERRVHTKAVPRLGGVAIFLAFVIASLCFYVYVYASNHELQFKEFVIYWLFLAGATLIVLVHAYDDIKGLKPLTKLLTQTLAVLIILGPFVDRLFHGVLLFGFNNPFGKTEITLFIHTSGTELPPISWLAVPAILLTWFWITGMMNTVNLIDGLDGLATGVVAITALFITSISWFLQQYTIATLAAIFTGAVLGFLPHNWNPAKIFMGDSGSQFLGLALAVLSIMGGAKVALILMVFGIPILDVALVMLNRVRRGQSPLHYDKTHLHHRLLATGLSVKQICAVLYGLTFVFGTLALSFTFVFGLPRIFKLLGLGLVGLAMVGLILWMDYRQRQRGVIINLDGPDNGPAGAHYQAAAERTQEQTLSDATNAQQPDSPDGHLRTQLPR